MFNRFNSNFSRGGILPLPPPPATAPHVKTKQSVTAIFNLHFNSCPPGLSYPFLELGLKFPLEAIYDVRTCTSESFHQLVFRFCIHIKQKILQSI